MMWSGNLLNNISSLLSFSNSLFFFPCLPFIGGKFCLGINEAEFEKQTKQTTPPKKHKKKNPKPHNFLSPFRGEKRVKGLVRAQAKDVFGTFFFPCLENLPDYFLTFPVLSAQEPGWVWGSTFSSLLCLRCRSPPTPKAPFFWPCFPRIGSTCRC